MSAKLSTSAQQCVCLLAYLQGNHAITTQAVRMLLDILLPTARILELKKAGWQIHTYWITLDTPLGHHRIARYVLFSSAQGL